MEESNEYGLKEVFSPPTATLHVVLIHGLNGDRSSTWTNKHGEFWPTWIGEKIPDARVWVYGYDTTLRLAGSQVQMSALSVNLLQSMVEKGVGRDEDQTGLVRTMLIGHSLGGIVIKQAILKAKDDKESDYSYLLDTLVALCFCGTPHRGSAWAPRLFTASSRRPTPRIVRIARISTPQTLDRIAGQFESVWGDRPVLTFTEGKGVFLTGVTVRADDAVIDRIPSETRHHMNDKNHRDLVRPVSKDDPFFLKLVEFLINEIPKTRQPVLENPPYAMPNPDTGALSSHTVQWLWKEMCSPKSPWTSIQDPGSNFSRGTFDCKWPPGSMTSISLVTDLSNSRIEWLINSKDSKYYPGMHHGKILLNLGSSEGPTYPFSTPRFTWDTHIYCSLVSGHGDLTPAAGSWDDIWSPVMQLHDVLRSFASIIYYGPLLASIKQDVRRQIIEFQPCNDGNAIHVAAEARFQEAANFFSRVYNTLEYQLYYEASTSSFQSNVITDRNKSIEAKRDDLLASVNTIIRLVWYAHRRSVEEAALFPADSERTKLGLVGCFSSERIKTRSQWMLEEIAWADVLEEQFVVKKKLSPTAEPS